MQDLPHHYSVSAEARSDSNVRLSAKGLEPIESAAPAEFGGPGDRWSPESLLVAAVVDCFVLSFKAIARGMSLEWQALNCEIEGTLDRVDRITQFTELHLRATLKVPRGMDEQKALRIMEKAKKSCLISSSLKCPTHLQAEVRLEA